ITLDLILLLYFIVISCLFQASTMLAHRATGEFSALTGFSHKALRIYDEKGLLKPAYVDPDSKYRYYTNLNLIDSNMIKEFKELGLSLQEIKEYFSERTNESLKQIYSEKFNDINDKIKHLKSVVSYLEIRMNSNIEKKSDDVIMKNIGERLLIYQRDKMPCNPEAFASGYFNLLQTLRNKKAGFIRYMAVFHDEPENFNPLSADIEIAAEVAEVPANIPNFRVMIEGIYLTYVAKGKYSELIEGYKKIMNFANENNFIKNGPAVEIYYSDFINEKNPENFITELQVPVKLR
ncbi:MAG: MerR family transcriptional regulator, partial [Spirochaetes bacterium]|nr:MerR family transcriptional regulator [Spirochaetota bacterium]